MSSIYNQKSVFDVNYSRTTIFKRVCLQCLRRTNFIPIFSRYEQIGKYVDLGKSFVNLQVLGPKFFCRTQVQVQVRTE